MYVSPAIFALVSLFIAALSSAATAFIGLGKGRQQLDDLAKTMTGIDTKIEALGTSVNKHNSDIAVQETKRETLEKMLNKVEADVSAFERNSEVRHRDSYEERQRLREEIGRLIGLIEANERITAEVRRSMDYLRDEGMKNVATMLAQIAAGANRHGGSRNS